MKKELLKKILVPALAAVAFGSVSVGTTFALFTSKAETTIDLTAGEIDLKAPVTISSAWELNDVAMTKNSDFDWTNSIGAHIYKDANQIIHLDQLAPGDGAEFTLTPDNSLTNINIKARLAISLQGELAPALEIEALAGTERQLAFRGVGTAYTPWQNVAVGENPTAFKVKVSFPDHDDGEILHGTANKDNQYQSKSATISLSYEAIQGNADVDDTLELINTTLNTATFTEGKNNTMYDALQDLTPAQVTAISERGYVWSAENDRFCSFSTVPADAYKYFKMCQNMPTSQDYSIYAVGDNWDVVSGLTVGFDAGETTTVSSVTYDRSTATVAREVTIRTNRSATELHVNAPLDTVHHYGIAGVVDIQSVAATSYHEKGTVSLAKIKNGRLVVAEESEIAGVHVVATEGNYNGIKIAIVGDAELPSFTRDEVALENNQSKLVIEAQTLDEETSAPTAENTQYIWITGVGDSDVAASVSSSSETASAPVATESAAAAAVKTEARKATSAEKLEKYEEAAVRFAGGIGTEEKPYLVKTEEHLDSLNEDVENGDTVGVYYKLVSDFTLKDFGMIGSALYTSHGEQSGEVDNIAPFSGIFDGDGHTVTYSINREAAVVTNSGGVGFFGCADEAVIKNLTVNANVNWVGSGNVGGLAGVLCNSQVSNVTLNGTIKGYKVVGGFAGLGYTLNNDNPTSFTNCVNNAKVITSYDTTSTSNQYICAGGFIGEGNVYNYNGSFGGSLDNRMTFTNCRNNGSFQYLGENENSIACFSNFIGFSSDSYFGSFYFNNCTVGTGVSYEGTLATQRTVSNKTILTGYSAANALVAPTIKYIGISSNVWGGTAAKNAIYVDGLLVEGSTGDHIQVNG